MSAIYLEWMKVGIAESITDAIQQLLEDKHLYQNLDVNYPEFRELFEEYVLPELRGSFPTFDQEEEIQEDYELGKFIKWRIIDPNDPKSPGSLVNPEEIQTIIRFIYFEPPTVRTFCAHCKNKQPFNFMSGFEVLDSYRENVVNNDSSITQVFIFMYQCQQCKELPEVFMVRRKNLKLTLSGRSPMETVEVPNFLPKNQHKFFSDSTVAFNSGQVLAAIFLLRTFIEQYVRPVNSKPRSRDIDAIFNDYSDALDIRIKEHSPSLKKVYEILSEDMHSATGSENVFLQARAEIIEHFDAKRLYKIKN